jgi:hypothetical protein
LPNFLCPVAFAKTNLCPPNAVARNYHRLNDAHMICAIVIYQDRAAVIQPAKANG